MQTQHKFPSHCDDRVAKRPPSVKHAVLHLGTRYCLLKSANRTDQWWPGGCSARQRHMRASGPDAAFSQNGTWRPLCGAPAKCRIRCTRIDALRTDAP
jgi:hypothetical protein